MGSRGSVRIAVAVLAAAGLGLLSAGTAAADPVDDQYVAALEKLGVPLPEGVNMPQAGREICDVLTAGQINPAPAVRGVVTKLEGGGLDRPQAIGMLRASVAFYCPQYSRFVAR